MLTSTCKLCVSALHGLRLTFCRTVVYGRKPS